MADDERQDTPQDEPTPERPEAQEPPAEQPEAEAPAEQPDGEAPAEQPDGEAPAEESQAEAPAAEPDAEAPAEEPEAKAPAEEPEGEAPAEEPEGEAPAEQPEAEAAAAEPEGEAAAEQPEADAGAEQTEAEQPQAEERPRPKPRRDRKQDGGDEPEVIPGAHLEPDLVLEDEPGRREGGELDQYADQTVEEEPAAEAADAGEDVEEAPGPVSAVFDLAADARYRATGKRKSAVARVTLRPGTGRYVINGKDLAEYFPRATLQTQARRPLETVGQQESMDVVAKIHGGGVSAQAGALRHGITRALVEADPNLRGELKRRGFLTRDPRVKERKKAGLKKARKRPQFSKR